ncbi:hypothetical protein OIV83_004023 [Microbotryomycetes sp. JL201]|nr:hypothetical protein OIV83_004023 [Microbotryomycetes sp. JL201]
MKVDSTSGTCGCPKGMYQTGTGSDAKCGQCATLFPNSATCTTDAVTDCATSFTKLSPTSCGCTSSQFLNGNSTCSDCTSKDSLATSCDVNKSLTCVDSSMKVDSTSGMCGCPEGLYQTGADRCIRKLSLWTYLKPLTVDVVTVQLQPKAAIVNISTNGASPYDVAAKYLLPDIKANMTQAIYTNRMFTTLGPLSYLVKAPYLAYLENTRSDSVSGDTVYSRLYSPAFAWGIGGCAVQGTVAGAKCKDTWWNGAGNCFTDTALSTPCNFPQQ